MLDPGKTVSCPLSLAWFSQLMTDVNWLDQSVDHALAGYFIKLGRKNRSKSKANYSLQDLGTKIMHH